jgi:hypothetical protein
MTTSKAIGTASPMDTFKFPFSDPRWIHKILIGFLLVLASLIIPVAPSFFLVGYQYKISRRIIKEDGIAALPEWDDWGDLFVTGFKYWAASIIYNLPTAICMLIAYSLMILPAFFLSGSMIDSRGNGMMPGMSIFLIFLSYPFLGLGILLSLLTGIITPPALMHLVDKGSFEAAFHIKTWWKIFRANLGGFVISFLLLFACLMLLNLVSTFLMMTVVLSCLYPILLFLVSVYIGIISSALFAKAYRTGVERMAGIETGVIRKVKSPSFELPADQDSKPPHKPRKSTLKS